MIIADVYSFWPSCLAKLDTDDVTGTAVSRRRHSSKIHALNCHQKNTTGVFVVQTATK